MQDQDFSPSLQSEESDYDPFAHVDDVQGESNDETPAKDTESSKTQDGSIVNENGEQPQKPASERIADLLHSMQPRRRVLLGIIAFCDQPKAVSEVNAHIDQLQSHDKSVYSPADLCELLEKAGAIERIDPSGEDAHEFKQKPKIVTVDGVEYLQPATEREVFWKSTDEGKDVVAQDDPADRTQKLLQEDAKYARIYEQILNACKENPQSVNDLGSMVNGDPLLKQPRLYVQHFIDRLEKDGALLWDGAWTITQVGEDALTSLQQHEE